MAGLKCDRVLPTPLLWKGVVIKGFGRGSKVRKLHNTPPWLGLGFGRYRATSAVEELKVLTLVT
jgi:hypothetical protein